MKWICRNCYQESNHIRTYVNEEGDLIDSCNKCGDVHSADAGVPDVYLERSGQKFQNLCDEMGRPYEITSKRQKKEVMDKLGVSEAGDRVNGAPYGSNNWIEGSRDYRKKQFNKDRPKLREIYKQWREKYHA